MDTPRLTGEFQPEIGHHGADNAARHRSTVHTAPTHHVKNLVAIDQLGLFIDHHNPVAIPIQRNSDIRVIFRHQPLKVFGFRRAAILVDVEPIGIHPDRNHFRSQFFEH